MTVPRDPDRKIRAYLDEGRTELPDHAYDAVRADIDRTRQRVVIGPWREPRVSTVASLAFGAAAVLMVGVIGLTVIGTGRSPTGVGAGSQVGLVWSFDHSVAVTILRDPTDDGDYYWRAATYDRLELGAWSASTTASIDRPAGTRILEGEADDVARSGLHRVTFTVSPGGFTRPTILSPATPVEVDEATRLQIVGKGGYFATLDRGNGSGPYTVTALVPVPGNGEGQLNSAALRRAGTNYPPEIVALYTTVANGSIGPEAKKLEAKIVAEAVSGSPVDLANQIVAELGSTAYTYSTDVRDLPCERLSTVECFATFRKGFCQYYAMTMAVLLRDLGVPTRIAEGFLPGIRDRSSGSEVVANSNAHVWVEVYFPGYGWVPFDPTVGDPAVQLGPLPSGLPSQGSDSVGQPAP